MIHGAWDWIKKRRDNHIEAKLREIEERNGKHFDEEVFKLDSWADDLKGNLEREVQTMDQIIGEARTKARAFLLLPDAR